MITDADVKRLKLDFLTKKEFKEEAKKFATKVELEKLDARTAEGFLEVQKQFSEVKSSIKSLDNRIGSLEQRILTMDDHIMGALHTLTIENKITANYRPKIENHEQRITKVESVVFAG